MFCFGLTDDDGQAQPYKMHLQFLVHKPFALFLFFPSSGQFSNYFGLKYLQKY